MPLGSLGQWSRTTAIALAALLVFGWLAWLPSAQEPPYRFIRAWGEHGSGPGQFNDPTGIAIAGNEVFVADSRNGRIQVFDVDGHFKRQFGTPGQQPGQLGRPMNLTVHAHELYVAEYFNDRIQVFGLDGTPKRVMGSSGHGPGAFNAPGGVAVASDGTLFVPDFYNHRVQQLRPNGDYVRQWGVTGEPGRRAGAFSYPTAVALGRDGSLYVADGYGNRIQHFDQSGVPVNQWGGPFAVGIPGPFNGWFKVVTGIAVGPSGAVFVADFYNHRIQKFSADGRFLTRFGRKGSGRGQFEHVIAVAVAGDGTVFAVDFGNQRVEKWVSATLMDSP